MSAGVTVQLPVMLHASSNLDVVTAAGFYLEQNKSCQIGIARVWFVCDTRLQVSRMHTLLQCINLIMLGIPSHHAFDESIDIRFKFFKLMLPVCLKIIR